MKYLLLSGFVQLNCVENCCIGRADVFFANKRVLKLQNLSMLSSNLKWLIKFEAKVPVHFQSRFLKSCEM